MPCEIPETSFVVVSSVDEHVEAVDTEKSWVPLATGEHVKGRSGEADVAHNVWGFKQLLDGCAAEKLRQVPHESWDSGGNLNLVVRVDCHSAQFAEKERAPLVQQRELAWIRVFKFCKNLKKTAETSNNQ